MYSLGIGPDTTVQTIYPVIYLHGPSVIAPFRGAFYDQPGGPGETVKEEIDLQMDGAPEEFRTGMEHLEHNLQLAREYNQLGLGWPFYLWKQPAAGWDTWRSRIVDGWVEKRKGEGARGSAVVRLHLERLNYWEGPEMLVPLTNLHGIQQTQLLQVYNHNDAAHSNYAEIAQDGLVGDLPAPCRLEMNGHLEAPATGWYGNVFIGLNANLHPDVMIDHWLEGEEGGSTVGVNTPAAGLTSNDSYKVLSWGVSTETDLIGWTLTSELMGLGDGRYFRPLIRFFPGMPYNDLWLKLKIKSGAVVIWESGWNLMQQTVEIQELPTIQLPPYLIHQNSLKPLYLFLTGKRDSVDPHTIGVDYLQLTPLDGWRKLVTRGLGCGGDDALTDDGFNNTVYIDELGDYKTDYIAYGEPILLRPGRLQRLYFLMLDRDAKDAEPFRCFKLRLYYRPRCRRV